MDELHLYTDKGQLGISAERTSTSGAIFFTRPCSTLPGPTSIKVFAPSLTMLRTLWVHLTGAVSCKIRFFLIVSESLTATVVTF